mgnify:CR=1 FL=1
MIKFKSSDKHFLDNYNDGDYFKIEEINLYFSPVNPSSRYRQLSSENQKLNFLHTKRWNNLLNQKPINSGLPDSKEEAEAIKKMIEKGESRTRILNFFQRSEKVLGDIIKKNLEGELDNDDPYILAAKKLLDQTK